MQKLDPDRPVAQVQELRRPVRSCPSGLLSDRDESLTRKSERSAELLASAVQILKSRENTFTLQDWRITMAKSKASTEKIRGQSFDTMIADETPREPKQARHRKAKAETAQPIDDTPAGAVQLGFSIFNQAPVKESLMSAQDAAKKAASPEEVAAAKAEREAAKAAKAAAKEEAKQAKAAERQANKAAKEEAKLAKAAEREAAKAEREARLAELGPQAKMAALRDAKNRYVKSATGQLRSTDEIAEAFDRVTPAGVIRIALDVLGLEQNPYAHLNVGQQSMNLRNKLRGALRKGLVTVEQITNFRDSCGLALSDEDLAPKRKPKEEATAESEETAEA